MYIASSPGEMTGFDRNSLPSGLFGIESDEENRHSQNEVAGALPAMWIAAPVQIPPEKRV
jgi:hypothetical protein